MNDGHLTVWGGGWKLPPVIDNMFSNGRRAAATTNENQVFAFNSESWPSCIDTVVQLTEGFRQKDERFVVDGGEPTPPPFMWCWPRDR